MEKIKVEIKREVLKELKVAKPVFAKDFGLPQIFLPKISKN